MGPDFVIFSTFHTIFCVLLYYSPTVCFQGQEQSQGRTQGRGFGGRNLFLLKVKAMFYQMITFTSVQINNTIQYNNILFVATQTVNMKLQTVE